MKKTILSLVIIGAVFALVGATVAYFRDTETSKGNTMTAGSLDLKIDLHCPGDGCEITPPRDLYDEPAFFRECDIKPGDSGEVTISWHVDDNNAWARLRVADIYDWENKCNDAEIEAGDTTCGNGYTDGELSQYLKFIIWLDEGSKSGWQCGENPACDDDPQEGNNVLDGNETISYEGTIKQLLDSNGYVFPEEFEASTTYYVGLRWKLPLETGNIVQSDSLSGKIIMEVVQSRNNPNPWE